MTCKFNYYCVHCIVYYIQKFICKKNSILMLLTCQEYLIKIKRWYEYVLKHLHSKIELNS